MFLGLPSACLELALAESLRLGQLGSQLHACSLCSHVGGSCVKNCGPGFYSNPEMGECEPCHQACETCTGLGHNQCSSCRGGLQLLHGTCVRPARTQVEGSFWNGNVPPERARRSLATSSASPTPKSIALPKR